MLVSRRLPAVYSADFVVVAVAFVWRRVYALMCASREAEAWKLDDFSTCSAAWWEEARSGVNWSLIGSHSPVVGLF